MSPQLNDNKMSFDALSNGQILSIGSHSHHQKGKDLQHAKGTNNMGVQGFAEKGGRVARSGSRDPTAS